MYIQSDIPCISSLMDIHGIQGYTIMMYIPCLCGGLHIRGIHQAYSRHILEIGFRMYLRLGEDSDSDPATEVRVRTIMM
jgi:hypothetical protein